MISVAIVLAALAQTPPSAPAPSPPASAPPAQPASQPSHAGSQPAGTPGKASDVQADVTFIFEIGENALNVQEGWQLSSGGRFIAVPELRMPMPSTARFAQSDPKGTGWKDDETSRFIHATQPLSGNRDLNLSYVIDSAGGSASLVRPIPYTINRARIVIQDAPGISIETNVQTDRRTHELNGITYLIHDVRSMPYGADLRIELDGLPSRTLWPRRAAVGIVAAILLWMIWALRTGSVPGREEGAGLSPLSARARRDQIVKAIEVLERDLREDKIKLKRYERRHGELMKELALVLREIELQKQSGRDAVSTAADA